MTPRDTGNRSVIRYLTSLIVFCFRSTIRLHFLPDEVRSDGHTIRRLSSVDGTVIELLRNWSRLQCFCSSTVCIIHPQPWLRCSSNLPPQDTRRSLSPLPFVSGLRYHLCLPMSLSSPTKVVFPPPPPTTNSLTAPQRAQLLRKTRKLEKILGTAPHLVDTTVINGA
jgi:hypothetical protein